MRIFCLVGSILNLDAKVSKNPAATNICIAQSKSTIKNRPVRKLCIDKLTNNIYALKCQKRSKRSADAIGKCQKHYRAVLDRCGHRCTMKSHLSRTAKLLFSTICRSKIELVPLSSRKIDIFDNFLVKNRASNSSEPQNRFFQRFFGQKLSWYLCLTGKSTFSTIFGSKIELVTLSNRKIDFF